MGDYLYYVDDTGFDKIAQRASAVMICAGNAGLIDEWKTWFLSPVRPYFVPRTQAQRPDGSWDSIILTILRAPDFTVDFTCGPYDDFEDAASFCGSGALPAKDCYSVNGCSSTCIETAKTFDPMTGGEIKYYDVATFQHNLSSPVNNLAQMTEQLIDRGMVMNTKNGEVTYMNPLSQEALKKAIGAGTVTLSAPTGHAPRAWTEREKEDVLKAMQRIVDREQPANG